MSQHHVFAADWLSLREAADHAARSEQLLEALLPELASHAGDGEPLSIVDLGAGTGSNLRWLAPRLPHAQRWTLVDRDTDLLARAVAQAVPLPAGTKLEVQGIEADLQTSSLPWIAGADLVTAAAFFDLVSAAWIERLCAACAAAGVACLFVLSVDGRWDFIDADGHTITDEDDLYLQDLFNQHQRRDKGLGAALGPEAAPLLAAGLAAHGLRVTTRPSDWQLAAGQPLSLALGRELMAGWRQAALEWAQEREQKQEQEGVPAAAARIEAWHMRRQTALSEARLGLRVGHVDVLALPPK